MEFVLGDHMFKKTSCFALLLVLVFGFISGVAQTPDVGQKAPPFSLPTPDGKTTKARWCWSCYAGIRDISAHTV